MKMKLVHIRLLLDRYYDGISTLEEEQELREFFTQPALMLPDDLRADAELFCEMAGLRTAIETQRQEEADLLTPMGMDQRLRDMIVQLEHKDRKTPTLWWRIAACLLVVVGTGLYYQHLQASPYTDTCKTPEEARMQMERALTIVNHHTGQGSEQLMEELDKANNLDETKLDRFISFQ